MKILGIIPARGGSKGVPGKNIKKLGGKPLLQYTSDIALKCRSLTKVILSSDDDEIISVAKKLGIEVPFKRPSNLASDSAPTLPLIKHALEFYKEQGIVFDAVCLLQVTSPFRTLVSLEEAIEKFIQKNTDSLVSVREVPHEFNPHWTFKMDENEHLKISTGEGSIITRRQDLPTSYHRDGSIYITKSEVILDKNSLYGNSICSILSPQQNYVNIDSIEDWKQAELMVKNML